MSNTTGTIVGNSLQAQPEKQTPPSTLSSDHQSEKSQNAIEPKIEAKPGPPGGSEAPGGGKPFGPGMGPAVEYPKGLKLYSIIVPLYFTAFLTALALGGKVKSPEGFAWPLTEPGVSDQIRSVLGELD